MRFTPNSEERTALRETFKSFMQDAKEGRQMIAEGRAIGDYSMVREGVSLRDGDPEDRTAVAIALAFLNNTPYEATGGGNDVNGTSMECVRGTNSHIVAGYLWPCIGQDFKTTIGIAKTWMKDETIRPSSLFAPDESEVTDAA